MFCDPDIFFYRPVDELYLNLMKKYKLNIIGISHSSAAKFVYTYFPNVMNLMVKKSDLPDENFMKDRVNGKWLTRAELFDLAGNFPNPKGEFDTGCFLCYWAILNNWKWLSFQTQDIHTYCPIQNRGNVKPEKLDKEKMLYHATSSTCPTGWNERFQAFKEAWEQ
jgi:hypothetical protein